MLHLYTKQKKMDKNININASKLVFKPSFAGASKITVFIKNLQRHHPISREQIILCISKGLHHDKINAWFTPESIKAAIKPVNSTDKKDKKNES